MSSFLNLFYSIFGRSRNNSTASALTLSEENITDNDSIYSASGESSEEESIPFLFGDKTSERVKPVIRFQPTHVFNDVPGSTRTLRNNSTDSTASELTFSVDNTSDNDDIYTAIGGNSEEECIPLLREGGFQSCYYRNLHVKIGCWAKMPLIPDFHVKNNNSLSHYRYLNIYHCYQLDSVRKSKLFDSFENTDKQEVDLEICEAFLPHSEENMDFPDRFSILNYHEKILSQNF